MNFRCIKCDSENYEVKTAFMAEKTLGLRMEVGTYYLKICSNCGYTEMYSAKILDKDEKPEPQH